MPEVLHTLPAIVELCFCKHVWSVAAIVQRRGKIWGELRLLWSRISKIVAAFIEAVFAPVVTEIHNRLVTGERVRREGRGRCGDLSLGFPVVEWKYPR